MNASDNQSCLPVALRLLSRRDHSCAELSQKLVQRGFRASQIASVIAECKRMCYLDDEKFSHRYAAQLQRKGYGVARIAQALRGKGVSAQYIEMAVQQYGDDCVQAMACRQVLVKKLSTVKAAQPTAVLKGRLFRFLSSRGFASAVIQQVFLEIAWED